MIVMDNYVIFSYIVGKEVEYKRYYEYVQL